MEIEWEVLSHIIRKLNLKHINGVYVFIVETAESLLLSHLEMILNTEHEYGN